MDEKTKELVKKMRNAVGMKIGKINILAFAKSTTNYGYNFFCVCECGNHFTRNASIILRYIHHMKDNSKCSCGCKSRKRGGLYIK